MNTTEKATKANQSSEKLLIVLEALSSKPEAVRLQDLAKELKMNQSTLLRFLTSLQNMGYVNQNEDSSKYFLTNKICAIANRVSSNTDVRTVSGEYLRKLANDFGESTNLAVEQNMMMTYIEVVNGPNQVLVIFQRIGNIAPMHCTGVGKLIMLDYTGEKIDKLISEKGLQRFTENTICTKEKLIRELETVRINGYAFDNEECEIGVRCVAAPIRDFTGKIIAGISVSGPATRMTDRFIGEKLHLLMESAREVSRCLGYNSNI